MPPTFGSIYEAHVSVNPIRKNSGLPAPGSRSLIDTSTIHGACREPRLTSFRSFSFVLMVPEPEEAGGSISTSVLLDCRTLLLAGTPHCSTPAPELVAIRRGPKRVSVAVRAKSDEILIRVIPESAP